MHDIANASPILSCIIVDEVGTIFPGPASITFGVRILISEFLYKIESFFDVMQIKVIFITQHTELHFLIHLIVHLN